LLLNDFQVPTDTAALPEEFAVAGGADGVAAALLVRPSERRTVVVLANVDSFPVETLARLVDRIQSSVSTESVPAIDPSDTVH